MSQSRLLNLIRQLQVNQLLLKRRKRKSSIMEIAVTSLMKRRMRIRRIAIMMMSRRLRRSRSRTRKIIGATIHRLRKEALQKLHRMLTRMTQMRPKNAKLQTK